MKIFVFGQGAGGNAALWLEKFEEFRNSKTHDITYFARTPLVLPTTLKVISPYGRKLNKSFLGKVKTKFISKYFLNFRLKRIGKSKKFDGVLLQGNYVPSMNLKVLEHIKGKSILNIYGSDFYRNYRLDQFTPIEKNNFAQVLDKVDTIVCNWETTKNDLVSDFPELKDKVIVSPWGVDQKWHSSGTEPLLGWPEAEKVFLSARALYDYNNIATVVEAFCLSFKDRPQYKLFIVNGYGNHDHEINRVRDIIKKYSAEEQVILKINEWIPERELIALYDRADFNICFGNTDQLTVSIIYGYLRKAINILSPLPSYRQLNKMGYKSHKICSSFDINDLSTLFKEVVGSSTNEQSHDIEKALSDFNMEQTFNKYLESFIEDKK